MDRLTSLAVFARIVESGSFAEAARHFGLSPAMVSKHVQALEGRLGARLLNRTTRRVSPTEIGRGFYERARQILADLDEAERTAAAQQTTPRGLLRVSAPVSFGIMHLAPAVADYLAACPEVSVDVSLNDRFVDLLEEGVDVAIRGGRLPESSLVARRLLPLRLVLCAAPAYLARRGIPRTLDDLEHHNCLTYSLLATRGEWRFAGAGGKEIAVPVGGRLQANNAHVLRVAALRGEGIILEPSFLVGMDIAAGGLVPLLPDHPPIEHALYAVYPHSRNLSTKVRSFIDFLVARFGGEPEWDRWQAEAGARWRAPA